MERKLIFINGIILIAIFLASFFYVFVLQGQLSQAEAELNETRANNRQLAEESKLLEDKYSFLYEENEKLREDMDLLIRHIAEASQKEKTDMLDILPRDVPSPQDLIGREQIFLYRDKLIIQKSGLFVSSFADTDSMDPVIDQGANGIEMRPADSDDVQAGDIVSYRKGDDIIIHRVIKTGSDEDGWYALLKGDNEKLYSLSKVRFNQINGVLVGVIY